MPLPFSLKFFTWLIVMANSDDRGGPALRKRGQPGKALIEAITPANHPSPIRTRRVW